MARVGQWSHSLFGCFEDVTVCIITFLAPCVTFGKNAEAVGAGPCLKCGLASMIPVFGIYLEVQNRERIREMKGIEGSTVNDILTVIFCPFCALIQESLEISVAAPASLSMDRQ